MTEEKDTAENEDVKTEPEAPVAEAAPAEPAPEPAPAATPEPVAEPVAAEPVSAEPQPAAPVMDAKEVEDGKAFALLSYGLSLIGIPFFLVPLIMRNNEFSLYHSKQCLIMWLLGAVGGTISAILMAVCVGAILVPALGIYLLVVAIMGLINSSNGEAKPLPWIGKWGEDWFKGITKA